MSFTKVRPVGSKVHIRVKHTLKITIQLHATIPAVRERDRERERKRAREKEEEKVRERKRKEGKKREKKERNEERKKSNSKILRKGELVTQDRDISAFFKTSYCELTQGHVLGGDIRAWLVILDEPGNAHHCIDQLYYQNG